MTSTCYASTRGTTMRATKLNQCCKAITDACGQVVTDGFVSVKITPNIEAATEIVVKNAADAICVNDPGCDNLKDMDVVITLCRVNPELLNIMTGQSLVLDGANSVGTRIKTGPMACLTRFALEVWGNVPGAACTAGAASSANYSFFLVPCIRNARISGDITIDGQNAISLEITGKTTNDSLWGSGPETTPAGGYYVAGTAANPTALSTPIGNKDVVHMQITPVPPPAVPVDCGCTSVVFV